VFDLDLVREVDSAARGDAEAWKKIVLRYSGLVWAVVRSHGLADSDAADAAQTTWLRLAENIVRIREPERLPSWLATTARRESIRLAQRASRVVPVGAELEARVDPGPEVEDRLLKRERTDHLWSAFQSLSPPCQSLLRVLMAEPAPSYVEVSAALGMPVGSIGPTRARCLDRLRTIMKPVLPSRAREQFA
jgi:RNA polymerase sigma factor (sigma-70 family)